MAGLTSLPNEVIERLFLRLDPVDAAHISQCCRFLWVFLYNPKDQLIWRELYLDLPLDDPRNCVSLQGAQRHVIDWRGLLQRFIRARTVLCYPSLSRPGERLKTLQTLLELTTWVPPLAGIDDFDNISLNLAWVVATLRGTPFFEDIELSTTATEEELQLCARLHTFFGLTVHDTTQSGRVRSRGFVYNMRNYSEETLYGPLKVDGSVNWVHMRAIHHIVSMHVVDLQLDNNFNFAIFPMSIQTTQIVQPTGLNLEEVEEDWAGVTGSWKVSFCFCDHRELLDYNALEPDASGNLDTSGFEAPDFGEVYRTLDVSITVVSTTPDPRHPKRPIIYFTGDMPDMDSSMNGSVQMTTDDQVQWQYASGENGNAVWYSLGIQVGGLRSPFGVLGSWTTVFHGPDDPVGPFWMRRESVAPGLPMNHVSLNITHNH